MDYAFAPGVSACLADGRLVILNVPADRYLMLPRDFEASVLRLLEGAPDRPGDHALRERLCTGGLVLERRTGSALYLCGKEQPSRSLFDEGWSRPPVAEVAVAGLRTFLAIRRLRFRGLEFALRRLQQIDASVTAGTPEAGRVAATFAELRVAMRSLDRCLPLSLALAESARRRCVEARLVLGVRCDPFGAHAWVQLGSTVLNDRLDFVRTFTPILVA